MTSEDTFLLKLIFFNEKRCWETGVFILWWDFKRLLHSSPVRPLTATNVQHEYIARTRETSFSSNSLSQMVQLNFGWFGGLVLRKLTESKKKKNYKIQPQIKSN